MGLLTPPTPATWMPARSREPSARTLQSTPPGSVLVVTLMVSDCLLESPSSRELTLRTPSSASRYPWRVRRSDWRHLRHLQQASSWLLRGSAGSEDDRWSQHPLQGRCCIEESSWNLNLVLHCHTSVLCRYHVTRN